MWALVGVMGFVWGLNSEDLKMENQHRKIKGYRELNQDEIDAMNKVKDLAEQVGQLVSEIESLNHSTGGHAVDLRWVSIAKTDLQKGFMGLTRAVAQPTTF